VLLTLSLIAPIAITMHYTTASPTATVPSITLDHAQGSVCSTVGFAVMDFPSNTTVEVDFGVPAFPDIVSVEVDTGPDGVALGSFTVPDVAPGTYTVRALDSQSDFAVESFTVLPPTITLFPMCGPAGSTVDFSVSNFPPNAYIKVFFGDVLVSSFNTYPNGFRYGSFQVPNVNTGTYNVMATDVYDTAGFYKDFAYAPFYIPTTNSIGTVTLLPDWPWQVYAEVESAGGTAPGNSVTVRPCNPLANYGLNSYASCYCDLLLNNPDEVVSDGGGSQWVSETAVYANGNEPMADAGCSLSVWDNIVAWGRYDNSSAAFGNWPYLIINKTSGEPLDSSTYFSIPLDLNYRMSLSASGYDALAEGDVSVAGGPEVTSDVGVGPDFASSTGGSPAQGTVPFTYSGYGGQLYMNINATVEPGYSLGFSTSEAQAIVAAHLSIDPSSPLASQLEVFVGKIASADPPSQWDPTLWAPSVETLANLTDIVPLMSPLTTPFVFPSPSTIDQGQSSNLTATLTTGTGPYTLQWYAEAPSASSYSSITGANSSIYNFTTSASTAAGSWNFMLQVTDSTGASVNSTVAPVTVLPARTLAAPTVTASRLTVDQGQRTSLAVPSPTTGTAPYTFQWYVEAPGASTYSLINDATSSSYNFTTSTSTATGEWYFIIQTTDSAAAAVNSTAFSVKVNSALAAPPVKPSPATVDQGQTSSLNSSVTTGTGPYTFQWYAMTPGASAYAPIVNAISSSYNFTTSTSTATGNWNYILNVRDSSGATANSTAMSVTVNAPAPTGTPYPTPTPTHTAAQTAAPTSAPTSPPTTAPTAAPTTSPKPTASPSPAPTVPEFSSTTVILVAVAVVVVTLNAVALAVRRLRGTQPGSKQNKQTAKIVLPSVKC
jgi:hypothetical protein